MIAVIKLMIGVQWIFSYCYNIELFVPIKGFSSFDVECNYFQKFPGTSPADGKCFCLIVRNAFTYPKTLSKVDETHNNKMIECYVNTGNNDAENIICFCSDALRTVILKVEKITKCNFVLKKATDTNGV